MGDPASKISHSADASAVRLATPAEPEGLPSLWVAVSFFLIAAVCGLLIWLLR